MGWEIAIYLSDLDDAGLIEQLGEVLAVHIVREVADEELGLLRRLRIRLLPTSLLLRNPILRRRRRHRDSARGGLRPLLVSLLLPLRQARGFGALELQLVVLLLLLLLGPVRRLGHEGEQRKALFEGKGRGERGRGE